MPGPLLNAGDPNSTFVPDLNDTLWEFEIRLKTAPFNLKLKCNFQNYTHTHINGAYLSYFNFYLKFVHIKLRNSYYMEYTTFDLSM